MSTTNNKTRDIRSYERTRAAGFVERYEIELRQAVAKLGATQAPDLAQQRDIANKVADRLKDIRLEIMGAVPVYRKPIVKDIDNFAGEEIEAAMDFINED